MKKLLSLTIAMVVATGCANTSPESIARSKAISACLEDSGFWRSGTTSFKALKIHNYCKSGVEAAAAVAVNDTP